MKCNEKLDAYNVSGEFEVCSFCPIEFMQYIVGNISLEETQGVISGSGSFENNDIAFTRIPFAVHFGFGIFMACLSLVVGLAVLTGQIVPPKKNPGCCRTVFLLILLLITVIFMALTVMLLLRNARLAEEGADEIRKDFNRDIFSIGAQLDVKTRNTLCLIKSHNFIRQAKKKLDGQMDNFMKKITGRFDGITGDKVFNEIFRVKQTALDIQKKAKEIAIPEIIPLMEKVSNDFLTKIDIAQSRALLKMNVFEVETRSLPAYFKKFFEKIGEAYDNFLTACKEALEKLEERVTDIEERVKVLLIGSGITAVTTYLLIGIWFPVLIAIMCFLTMIAIVIRPLFNSSSKETWKSRVVLNVKENVIVFAYVTVAFGAILFVLFSFGLRFGFEVMASSTALLSDSYVFDKVAVSLESLHSKESKDIKLMDIVAECRKNKTFFAAVHLNRLQTSQDLLKLLNSLIDESKYNGIFLDNLDEHKLYFDGIINAAEDIIHALSITDISAYRDDVQEPLKNFEHDMNNIISYSKETMQEITKVQTEHGAIVESITNSLRESARSLVKIYTNFLNRVEQDSEKCDDLTSHRRILKKLLIAKVVAPAQGQWFACYIAALLSIVAFVALYKSIKRFHILPSTSSSTTSTNSKTELPPDTQREPEDSVPAKSIKSMDTTQIGTGEPDSDALEPSGSKHNLLQNSQ
ncbi:hypothetical protein RB195_012139 [Necator americanus]|uniref:Prominin n=1 Tax=Necator americanus TaxID=51031 RepID=A0ABR1D5V6_NECAM